MWSKGEHSHIAGVEQVKTLLHCWCEVWVQTCTTTLGINLAFFFFCRKLGIVIPQDTAIPLLDINPKDAPISHKDTCSIIFIAASLLIGRNWKQPRCPSTEEWIKKMWYIYTMEYYSAMKNKDITNFAGKWMDLEYIILSEVTQFQKDITEIKFSPQVPSKVFVCLTIEGVLSLRGCSYWAVQRPHRQVLHWDHALTLEEDICDVNPFEQIFSTNGYFVTPWILYWIFLVFHNLAS